MSCIGKKPFNETVNIPVMRYSSSEPVIPMDFEPFLGKVWFALGNISVSFGQDLRLDYQEYYGHQPKIQYHVNTKVGPLSLLHQGFQFCQLFTCAFWSLFDEKGFLPKTMSSGQCDCDLTSNVGF